MKRTIAILVCSLLLGQSDEPLHYLVRRAPSDVVIDGLINDGAWQSAPWTTDFVDIEGSRKPAPKLHTRAKLLWDTQYLYIAAELAEPNVTATLTERDAVIFHDNDFEVFIDPDGDQLNYYELEINALGTVWDLLLTKPYRHGGQAINAWDIHGLKSAVHIDGTLNDARDTDRGWTVELALPWSVLREAARERNTPHKGEEWRLNFSRVEWDGPQRPPEHNWVWSPQGEINMHIPEVWGYVRLQ